MASRRVAITGFLLGTILFACPGVRAERGSPGKTLSLAGAPGREFLLPCDVAVDRHGVLFVLDAGRRSIFLFARDGTFVREIVGRGAWKDPQGIALLPDRTLLLADGESGRALEVDLSGTVRKEYPLGKGSRATAVASYGDLVYAADSRNARILVFRRSGERVGAWGRKGESPSEFSSPFRLAADPTGRIFVTDVMNSRVQWFSAFGEPLGSIRPFGAASGKLFRPSSLTIDHRGGFWVGDSYTGLVQRFDIKGTHIQSLGAETGPPAVFGDPVAIADTPGGIWVADQKRRSVVFLRK